MSSRKKASPEYIVQEIKRVTRRKFSAEEKIRIILEGLRGDRTQPSHLHLTQNILPDILASEK